VCSAYGKVNIISYTGWFYYRFNLSHRDIEDLPAERGINVRRESIRLEIIAIPGNPPDKS
jgi:putative transposase